MSMLAAVLLKVSPYISPYTPNLVAWAAGAVVKAALSERVKKILTTRRERNSFAAALTRATRNFVSSNPELTASFLDEHFLSSCITPEIEKFMTRDRWPDESSIRRAYEAQFTSKVVVDVSSKVHEYLLLIEVELKKEHSLQQHLTHRQSDEAIKILRKIETNQSIQASLSPITNISEANSKVARSTSLREKFRVASLELTSWPQGIDGSIWIERPELQILISRVETTKSSVSLLLGVPGAGKSALLAKLSLEADARNWAVLAIKADQLPDALASLDDLSAYCELPGSIIDCISELTVEIPVIVVIDQLDALGELLDLHTQRLSVMLRFIRQLAGLQNVHVFASCRTFERTYDKRLAAIEAEDLELTLPPWERVAEILTKKGLNASSWPESFREILRVPQYLKLFLMHFTGPGEAEVFNSYQTMLEKIWSERVFNSERHRAAGNLILDLAEEMAEREVLYSPLAKFDARRAEVDYLIGAGLLQLDHSGHQLSFAHQTIFDFARARAFISKNASLSRYVLARQSSLFVRSKLWSALTYVRNSDPETYELEVTAIWRADGLRSHLRTLLIEFIGQHENPSPLELRLLKGACTGQDCGVVLAATIGRKEWFNGLAAVEIPRVMAAREVEARFAIGTLEAAWPFAKNQILQLISAHWLADEQKRTFAWYALRGLADWDRRSVDLAISIVRTVNMDNYSVLDLASVVSVSQPQFAPELIAAQVEKAFSAARANPVASRDTATEGDPMSEAFARIRHGQSDPLRKILEHPASEWYEVSAIAEAAPAAYLKHVWPPIRTIVEGFASEHEDSPRCYRRDFLSSTMLEVDETREGLEHPLMDAFVYAVRACARTDETAFRTFVEENIESDAMTVQRLIALGLVEMAEADSAYVLSYLLGDVRRFSLENIRENERETKQLIRALGSVLDPPGLRRLEDAILNLRVQSIGAEEMEASDRLEMMKADRLMRIRLLRQLPPERLSADTRQLLLSESHLFPGYHDERKEVTVWTTSSPMNAEQLSSASDDTVERFIEAFPDSDWGGSAFERRGGSPEVSRAFAEFAKTNPGRAIALIERLDPKTHQRPVAYALETLAESSLDDATLFALIEGLNCRGFNSTQFREGAAHALRKRIKRPSGLPLSILAVLDRWLDECVIESDDTDIEERDREESFLWGYGRISVLPGGTYPIIDAWFFGAFAQGDEVGAEGSARIIAGLRRHLARKDKPRVWSALARGALQRLGAVDRQEAAGFLSALFDTYPDVLLSPAGAFLIATSVRWVDSAISEAWMQQLANAQREDLSQMYGELLGLRATVLPDDAWARAEITKRLAATDAGSSVDERVTLGLIYAASNLWSDTAQRDHLVKILVFGMDALDVTIARAAMDWFRLLPGLSWDSQTRAVVDAFSKGRALTTASDRSYALDRIGDIINDAPVMVYQICDRIIEASKSDLGNIATSAALESESLLSLSLTLQRQSEPWRTKGLDLFERLLQLNAYRVREVLVDIDRRPGAAVGAAKLRRRRRPKKKV
jgi:hypothetical protein